MRVPRLESFMTSTPATMLRLRSVTLAGALALVGLLPHAARAWDALGHMVVTRIAWSQLTPAVQAKVIALLEQAPADAGLAQLRPAAGAPDRDPMFAAYASTWPDIIRAAEPAARHAYHRPIWHYRDTFWSDGPDGSIVEVTTLQPDSLNLVVELQRQSAILRDSTVPAAERAVALAWVMHLAGDIAQPLHASGRVTPEEPAGDKGGNAFLLDKPMNLHWYWDRVLSDHYPRMSAEEDPVYVARVTATVLAQAKPDVSATAIANGDFELWAKQSLASAQHQVYCCGVERGHASPDAYAAHVLAVSQPAMVLAGSRLAALLNELLGA